MEILDRQYQFGRFTPLVQLDDGNGLRLSFLTEVVDSVILAHAQEIVDRIASEQAYNAIETIPFSILDHIDLLKEFVAKIKDNPTVTLTQYNTWLSTKPWYQGAIIRYFVFVLATKLADKNGIVLADLTETEVLRRLRDWIVATDLKTIGKVIGYGSAND